MRLPTGDPKARSSTDVVLGDISSNPQCEHGPSILFEKFHNGGSRKFYACSACRDRKICGFYINYEEFQKKGSQKVSEHRISPYNWDYHQKQFAKQEKVRNSIGTHTFCESCDDFIPRTQEKNHRKCTLSELFQPEELNIPMKILSARSEAKSEAQFLFRSNSTQTIVELIENLDVTSVLCIGTPRVHEYIVNTQECPLNSLLLDIDNRLCSFYPPEKFLMYNLFNNHFFGGESARAVFHSFLKNSQKLLLIMDPPFGGRMELIANTLRIIEEQWRLFHKVSTEVTIPLILVFPYFLENSVMENIENIKMLDYRVDYDNHSCYTTGAGGLKKGSPVRLFTNVDPSGFMLPPDQGYRLCQKCDKWVHKTNVHCQFCEGCMSKDGSTYQHCHKCGRCVKPTWKHCQKCVKCLPTDHKCLILDSKDVGKCHICHKSGHKRKYCPQKMESETQHHKQKKRKIK